MSKIWETMSREEAMARSKPILDQISYTAENEPQHEPKDNGQKSRLDVNSNEYKAFAHNVRFPFKLGRDRQAETGLSKDADSRAISKLKNMGLVRDAGKAGAKFQLYEPSDKGLVLAKTLGLPAAAPHKGGVVHQCLVHYLRQSLHSFCAELSFTETGASVTVGNVQVQPDLIAVRPSGLRLAAQCCVRNCVDFETDRLLRLFELTQRKPEDPDKFEQVICLPVNKNRRRSIVDAIKQKTGGSLPGSLLVTDFDEMMSNDFTWKDVITL